LFTADLHLCISQALVTSDQSVPAKFEHTVENENVANGILEWIAGEGSFSPSLLKSLATQVAQTL
jgi:hypothetical protein